MTTRITLMSSAAVFAILAGADAAHAGNYVSIFGGGNASKDVGARAGAGGVANATLATTVTHFTASTTQVLNFSFTGASNYAMSGASAETGWVLGAAIGHDFSDLLPGLRGELEFSFRNNSLKAAKLHASFNDVDTATATFAFAGFVRFPVGKVSILPPGSTVNFGGATGIVGFVTTTQAFQATFTGTANVVAQGKAHTYALMANVWYDIDVGTWMKPYFGGGAGFAKTVVEATDVYKGEGSSFAWQFGAGVNVALDATTSLDIGYRVMDAGTVELDIPLLSGGVAKLEHEVKHQSVTAGLTFKLE